MTRRKGDLVDWNTEADVAEDRARVGLEDYDAVLFDLDGVLTPTVEIHKRAWRELFVEYFEANGIIPSYTDADYFAHVDGRPRYEGVRECLASRGVVLPEGDPGDGPGAATVCGLGNAKGNAVEVNRILAIDGVRPYPGSVALLDVLNARGVMVAVVSSSRNTRMVLAAAGLADRFVVVDGIRAAAEGLAGKPQPDTYVQAAHDLGVTVGRAVVVEDAVSGVVAGGPVGSDSSSAWTGASARWHSARPGPIGS